MKKIRYIGLVLFLVLTSAYVVASQDYTFMNASFAGVVTAPTQTAGNNTTRLATTAFVQAAIAGLGPGSVTNVATTSPIGGGPITTTGTITCSTCVVASAPGAGIAHFAGSTQTVTSSAVVSADLNITPTSCTNQFITAISATVAGTCTTATLASVQFANQGTTTTLLHGNGAGNPSFGAVNLAADISGQLPIGNVGSAGLSGTSPIGFASTGAVSCASCVVASAPGAGIAHFAGSTQTVTSSAVVSADLNITTTTCTNQFITAISATVAGTCTTATLASAQFANQGTTTTLLHGNGAGNPSFGAVNLAADISGQLPIGNVGSAGLSGTSPIGFASTGAVSCSTCTVTVASGTSALATGAISSATCATVVTTSATGTATTDNIMADFNADPTAVTGYTPSASGMLTIIKYPTANNVNFKVCNNTAGSITPGAITLNWRVVR